MTPIPTFIGNDSVSYPPKAYYMGTKFFEGEIITGAIHNFTVFIFVIAARHFDHVQHINSLLPPSQVPSLLPSSLPSGTIDEVSPLTPGFKYFKS